MRRQVKKIGALSAGVMIGGICAVLALFWALWTARFMFFEQPGQVLGASAEFSQFGPLLIVFLPLIAAVCGFVAGAVLALLYTWLARPLGGLTIELSDPDDTERD